MSLEGMAGMRASIDDASTLLGSLEDSEWYTPSVAAGWIVKDVAIHLPDLLDVLVTGVQGTLHTDLGIEPLNNERVAAKSSWAPAQVLDDLARQSPIAGQEDARMTAITTDGGAGSAHRDDPYSGLPNKLVQAANGVGYPYRDTGGSEDGMPLILLRRFCSSLDNWDPALIDALATARRVLTFDNAGIGGSIGTIPDTIEQMARDAIAFLAAMGFGQVDLLGFCIGSFVMQRRDLAAEAQFSLAAPSVSLVGA